MEYKKFTAKSIEAAITNASVEFGVTSEHLEYHVVQEPTNGFLGIGSKPAVIEARVEEEKKTAPAAQKPVEKKVEKPKAPKQKTPEQPSEKKTVLKEETAVQKPVSEEAPNSQILTNDIIEKRAAAAAAREQNSGDAENRRENSASGERRSGRRREEYDRRKRYPYDRRRNDINTVPKHEPSKPKPERVIAPKSEEEVAELTQKATKFLSEVFEAMKLSVKMETSYNQKEGSLNITFSGDEMGILIGKRGQTLDSLQYLTSLVVNKGQSEYTRIKLDTEDYRLRREETLNNLARNIAYKVRKTHRPVSLEPMNPYERRIIHSALQNNKFVETYSEGEEPYRHVVVAPKR